MRKLLGFLATVLLVVSVAACQTTSSQDAFNATLDRAKAGNASAQNNVGWHYAFGNFKVVRTNYPEAISWLEKSLKAGYLHAPNNLGLLYRDGKGVAADVVTASALFQLGIGRGCPNAPINFKKLQTKLTDDEKASAKIRYEEIKLHGFSSKTEGS